MNFNKIYALGLRHLYLIMNSFPRILDLSIINCTNILWDLYLNFLQLVLSIIVTLSV